MRSTYTVAFQNRNRSPIDDPTSIDECEKISAKLRDLAKSAGYECSAVDYWRDAGWRFTIHSSDEASPILECIACGVNHSKYHFVAVFSVVRTWRMLFRKPSLSELAELCTKATEWIRLLEVDNISWALDASPNFDDADSWGETFVA